MRSVLCLLTIACSDVNSECINYAYAPLYGYIVDNAVITPHGVSVSAPENYDLDVLDRVTDEVYSCLESTYGSSIKLRPRSCFQVKIVEKWRLSCDGTQQLLYDRAPNESCAVKGLTQDYLDCPCSWRAAIQENEDNSPIIVTTPSLYLYKDPLLRYLTSCDYPWSSNLLSPCLYTSTDPLSLNIKE